MSAHEDDMRITREAAEWFMELQAEGSSCHEPFTQWLRRSPEHVEEFLAITGISLKLDKMDPQRRIDVDALLADVQSKVLALRASHESLSSDRTSKRRRNLWAGGLVAACALGAAVALVRWTALSLDTYVTHVGEQKAFRLDDGSVIFLNTRSRVRVNLSSTTRDIELIEGEALFSVERDAARPFRVRSGNATVEAIGTQFNVYRSSEGTKVFVVEGAVRVSAESEAAAPENRTDAGAPDSSVQALPVRLDAGEQADVRKDRIEKNVPTDAASVTAWRERKLIFHDKPLSEVVGEFNRYNSVKFDVDEDAGGEPLSGVFAADRPESLALFLARDPSIRIERHGDVFTIHSREKEP